MSNTPERNFTLFLLYHINDAGGRDRLFNPIDPDGDDLGGRFAFIIPSDE